MSIPLLKRAIKRTGGQAAVARELDLDRQAVNQWLRRQRVPYWHIPALKQMAEKRSE
jgi:hypothetical protein